MSVDRVSMSDWMSGEKPVATEEGQLALDFAQKALAKASAENEARG